MEFFKWMRNEPREHPITAPETQLKKGPLAAGAAAAASFMLFMHSIAAPEAFAAIECKRNSSDQSIEFYLQRKQLEPEHKIIFRPRVTVSDGTHAPPQLTTIFQDLTRTDPDVDAVNDTLENEEQFKEQLIPLINEARRALHLHWRSMNEMSPRDLVATTSWIVLKKIRYDYRLAEDVGGSQNKNYNKHLAQEVARQPVDVKLMRGGIGVCRDFASALAVVSRTIKKIAHSKRCDFVHIGNLGLPYDTHAINPVFELIEEGGKPVVVISFVDTTINATEAGRGVFTIDSVAPSNPEMQNISTTGLNYIAPILSEHDARDLLKCLLDNREGSALNLSVLNTLQGSYWKTQQIFEQQDDGSAMAKLLDEEKSYYKLILPDLLKELEQNKGDTEKDKYQRRFSLRMLEWMYRRLGDKENRLDAARRLFEAVEWSELLADYKINTGDFYADLLGSNGNIQEAITVFKRLFSDYQKYKKEHSGAPSFKRTISDPERGMTEIEPLNNEELLDQYLDAKKREWGRKE